MSRLALAVCAALVTAQASVLAQPVSHAGAGTATLLTVRHSIDPWMASRGVPRRGHASGIDLGDGALRRAATLGAQAGGNGTPWWAPLASAALPGAGQAALGQDRALAYLAVEAYGWLRYAADIREARRQRAGYRDIAARVARANLSEARPPGDFEYYERMEHYVESGVFDASADDGVQPETDPESYNGFIWLRARTTFWEDPTSPPPLGSDPYLAAMAYYADRAIKPEFRWSWRNAQLEQDLFRQTISRSNEAFRRSIQDLGVLIANHALSTVDAYVSIRVRNVGVGGDGLGVEATIPFGSGSAKR